MSADTDRILDKAVAGERLTFDEGVALFDCTTCQARAGPPTPCTRRLHPEPYRTYNIDRNINYTNVCAAVCDFCAFYRKTGDADAYVLPREELYKKIEETIALGGDQILLQGGNHPSLKLEWYEELLRDLKARYPQVNLHAFSAVGDLALPQAQQAAAARGARAPQGRRHGQPARRRRRDPRRPRPQGDHRQQGA